MFPSALLTSHFSTHFCSFSHIHYYHYSWEGPWPVSSGTLQPCPPSAILCTLHWGGNRGTFYKMLISSGCPSDLIMSKGPAHGLLSTWPGLIFSGYSLVTPSTLISLHADWSHSFCKKFHGFPCSMPLLLLFHLLGILLHFLFDWLNPRSIL